MSRLSKHRRDLKLKRAKKKINKVHRTKKHIERRRAALKLAKKKKNESCASNTLTLSKAVNNKSKKEKVSECYMCGSPASTKEHVPPKCLFPEAKDLPDGANLRKGLITVPACDVHNGQKSKDDVYILYTLVMNLTSNQIGRNQFLTKVRRDIDRNPSLISKFLEGHKPVRIHDTKTDKQEDTVALRIDLKRFNSALKTLVRALYYHHFKEKWLGRVSIQSDFLLSIDSESSIETNRITNAFSIAADAHFQGLETHGDNPEVFKYQIFNGDERCVRMFRLYFYDESRVTVFLGLDKQKLK